MSALFLCIERSSWEHFSGILRQSAFREMILREDLVFLGDGSVIVEEDQSSALLAVKFTYCAWIS